MMIVVAIHWRLRKGLGPEWIDKMSEICLDDLPEDTSIEEARKIAIDEFKIERIRNGTGEHAFVIKDSEIL